VIILLTLCHHLFRVLFHYRCIVEVGARSAEDHLYITYFAILCIIAVDCLSQRVGIGGGVIVAANISINTGIILVVAG
jgi:hypothetical protein